ncbi:MAG: carboxyltransferase domain-containing protein [Bacteroidota bacterium]
MYTSLQYPDFTVEVEVFHHDFVCLRSADRRSLPRLGRAIFRKQLDFVAEVVATEVELLLQLRGPFTPAHWTQLQEIDLAPESAVREWRLPVWWGGEADWSRVIGHTSVDRASYREQLIQTTFSVAMLGFLPGFAYLQGLPAALWVPRKTVPAKYVAAGSLAVGGKYLGVYALDSPGGWNVIGRTPLQLLQIPDLPPVPYLPGDTFRIEAIGPHQFRDLQARSLHLIEYHATT